MASNYELRFNAGGAIDVVRLSDGQLTSIPGPGPTTLIQIDGLDLNIAEVQSKTSTTGLWTATGTLGAARGNHRALDIGGHQPPLRLGVAAQESEMSFAVSCAASGVEWNGSGIGGLTTAALSVSALAETGSALLPCGYLRTSGVTPRTCPSRWRITSARIAGTLAYTSKAAHTILHFPPIMAMIGWATTRFSTRPRASSISAVAARVATRAVRPSRSRLA